MELLLNLIWITLATGAFLIFLHSRQASGDVQVSLRRALIALACVTLLLFPIVSASDDLHPTQAVLEDATRRVQHLISPLHVSAGDAAVPMLPLLLALGCLLTLAFWRPRPPFESGFCALEGHLLLCEGRAPPFFCH
jgi:hypothetical protein